MRYLFVHHNSPGQYKHLAQRLAAVPGNEVVFLTQKNNRSVPGVRKVEYAPAGAPAGAVHPYLTAVEPAMHNAEAVFMAARDLGAQGFRPDIMVGHNAWGEILCLKDVWPDVPLLGLFEFFYSPQGADADFDPEISKIRPERVPRLRMQNTVNLLGLDAADWGHCATHWQRRQYPAIHRDRISVIHEGVDTALVRPNPAISVTLAGQQRPLTRKDKVVTYVSRSLEPYRGFHVFMRALPEIQRRHPDAHVLVVGGDDVSYGGALSDGRTFREALLQEQRGRIDLDRVTFLGRVSYEQYLAVLQVSSVHVYLTYPFVLSWSLIEALSAGCLVVGSATPPVQEVIHDGVNGLLVDFFDTKGIADRVTEVLEHPDRMQAVRDAARQAAVTGYDLRSVALPRFSALLDDLLCRRRPRTYVNPAVDGLPALDRSHLRPPSVTLEPR